jgi:hypothetical protein
MARPGRQGEGRVARRVLHRSCTIPSKAETPWWSGGNDSRRPFRAPLPPTIGRGRPGSCHRVPVPAVYLGLVVRCPAPARGAVDGDVPTAVADHDGRQALVARRPGSFAPARLRRVLRSIREWDSSGGRGPHVAPPVDIDTGRRGHERATTARSHIGGNLQDGRSGAFRSRRAAYDRLEHIGGLTTPDGEARLTTAGPEFAGCLEIRAVQCPLAGSPQHGSWRRLSVSHRGSVRRQRRGLRYVVTA